MTPHRIKDIETLLQSRHIDVVLDTLDIIKTKGNIALIKPMIALLNDTDSEIVISAITDVLKNIKDQSAVPEFITAIENPNSSGHRSLIVAACWESGLNFDAYLTYFVDLALLENYLVCLECLTLIENMGNDIPEQTLLNSIATIKNATNNTEKKTELLVAMIGVLEEKLKICLKN